MTDHGITLPPLPHRALRPGAGDDAMQDYARAAVLLDRQQRDGPHHLVDALQDRAHPAEVLTPSTRSRVVVTTPAPSAEPVAHIFPSDVKALQLHETSAMVYSVPFGSPDERSVPLYTTPPDHTAVMRQALDALINARDTTYSDTLYPQFKVAIDALRAALEGKR